MIWKGLLILVAAVTLYFGGSAVVQLYRYWQLRATVFADSATWTVQELKGDAYALRGQYTFAVDGRPYAGEGLVHQEIFRNPYTAETAIPKWEQQRWTIWYNPSRPEQSALERHFPAKELVSMALLLAIFCYYYFLGVASQRRTG